MTNIYKVPVLWQPQTDSGQPPHHLLVLIPSTYSPLSFYYFLFPHLHFRSAMSLPRLFPCSKFPSSTSIYIQVLPSLKDNSSAAVSVKPSKLSPSQHLPLLWPPATPPSPESSHSPLWASWLPCSFHIPLLFLYTFIVLFLPPLPPSTKSKALAYFPPSTVCPEQSSHLEYLWVHGHFLLCCHDTLYS